MSLSHFFSITQTWRIAISWLDTPGRILSSTWYHQWLQLVIPMRQNAQKRSRKFCRSKEDKNGETHPIQPEKGETGCVSGAGEGCSRYGRVGKPEIRTKMHQIAMQHMKKENRRKPSVFAGFVAGAEGLEPSARGFGVDVRKRTGERGRGGVARFLLQVRIQAVLVWCCEEFLGQKCSPNWGGFKKHIKLIKINAGLT